jgi:hypothetical protein
VTRSYRFIVSCVCSFMMVMTSTASIESITPIYLAKTHTIFTCTHGCSSMKSTIA